MMMMIMMMMGSNWKIKKIKLKFSKKDGCFQSKHFLFVLVFVATTMIFYHYLIIITVCEQLGKITKKRGVFFLCETRNILFHICLGGSVCV